MRSLRVVNPADAGGGVTGVILQDEDGERFELTVDDALRAAVSDPAGREAIGGHDPALSATGQQGTGPAGDSQTTGTSDAHGARVRPKPPVPITPREIQVRVRAGEAPEDLAADTGNPLERIMRFAAAVLEERARVSDEARRARARRDGDGSLVPFGETVDRRFAEQGIDAQSVAWDALRRPDGTWVVSATWTAGASARRAHWAFSLTTRTVLPADEYGADLLSDRPLRPVVRAVPDHVPGQVDDRLDPAADDAAVYDQETSGYTRPRGDQPTGRSAGPSGTHPLNAPDPSRPTGLRLAAPLEQSRESGESPVAAQARTDSPTGPAGADASAPVDAGAAAELDHAGPHGLDHGSAELDLADLFEGAVGAPERSTRPVTRGTGRGKAAREQTRIPSWDDILLGVRRKQD